MDLVDRDGLENLSMRRLGSDLSVEAMALYHYVPTKAALLVDLGQSVVENAVRKASAATDGGRTRNDRLYRFALALHGELLLRPGALPILVSRPICSPESVRLLDGVAGRLRAERDDRARVKRLVGAIVALALGHAWPRRSAVWRTVTGTRWTPVRRLAAMPRAAFPVVGTPATRTSSSL
ncbi:MULTISPECIES: TetR/AcrR family transcriptional regulator [unclassified Nocardiopsis]|uniref:TetR/AcrR family transcriptional regulator n=1 Tax=unclassified Nocardiopsis TaxID=2649073 RepID=UPI001914E04F|nr:MULTISPECIES: hypothetical protein [unclassified Nocardiopsis]